MWYLTLKSSQIMREHAHKNVVWCKGSVGWVIGVVLEYQCRQIECEVKSKRSNRVGSGIMVLGSDFYLRRVASEGILSLWLAAWRDQIIMMGKARREREEASHAAATVRKQREKSAGWSSGFLISPFLFSLGSKLMGWRHLYLSGSFILSSTSPDLHLAIENAFILSRVSKVLIIHTI